MSESIKLDFFDINGEYKENVNVDVKKNFLLFDSPMRILEQYINNNFLQDLKKDCEDQYIIKYSFSYNIEKNKKISINCNIFNNFSVTHNDILESNGYFIFFNLEDKKTFELLEKLINYIIEYGSYHVKTYIIGVFNEKIEEKMNYENMDDFLANFHFEYEYYEMFIGDSNKFKEIKDIHKKSETMETIFKNIFQNIYGGERAPRAFGKGNGKKNNKYYDKDYGTQGCKNCEIF